MKSLTKEFTIINEGSIPFPILTNSTGWKSTEDNGLSVIESGEKRILLSKIIKTIDLSEELICLQSFLIQDGELINALIKAVKRGVKVFVLSSVEARLKESIEEETNFIKADYIKLLETKFKNHFVHRSAENFHGKYIIIDPNREIRGFICTNNFTDNGFTKNPELAVELSQDQSLELFKIFVHHFWEHSTDEQTASKEFDKVQPANKFSLPKLLNILLTSPNPKNNTLNDNLLKAVKASKKSISFSTFMLDKNCELIKTIKDKSIQGIDVTLFCRPIERQFNEHLKELLEAGIKIFFHPLIHAKSLLVDNKAGYIFSANLMERGLEKGLEVGICLDENQTEDLDKIHQNWKVSFPSKALKTASIKDLKEIELFKDGKLLRKIVLHETKEVKQNVTTVDGLISFFNKKEVINDNFIKSLKLKMTAEINYLPNHLKYNNLQDSDKFQLIEIEEAKGRKTKIVVIKKNFDLADLHVLNNLGENKLYAFQN